MSTKSWGGLRLAFALALALALLLTAVPTFAQDNGGTVPTPNVGERCVDGLVIDWEEMPIEEGWFVEATPIVDGTPDTTQTVTANPSEEDDEEGMFFFDDLSEQWDTWQFTINYDGFVGTWEPVTPDSIVVTFSEDLDDCVRIRFKLREIVVVTVWKIDENHNPLDDWTIYADPGKGNHFAVSQDAVTGEGAWETGTVTFTLTPGLWVFTEAAPDDTKYYPIVPLDGRQELYIERAADRDEGAAPYVIRFKNQIKEKGCIEVFKYDDTGFPLVDWEISVVRANGSEAAYGYTDAMGTIKFEHLPFGPYTVKEETRVGWENTNATSWDVVLTPNDTACARVEFVNRQAPPSFCIEGRKIDANGGYGIADWEISAEPLDKGGIEVDDVLTDGLGVYRFDFGANDYRLPGARYKVCEEDVDGWLPHTATCYTVQLPKHPGACVKVRDFVNQQVGHTESGRPNYGHSYSGSCSYYTAQKGDGLYAIGARHGVSASKMLAANPWIASRSNHYLYVGDKVCIPR